MPDSVENLAELQDLHDELARVRADMLEDEARFERWAETADEVVSQCNLLHYLALRRRDIRPLQRRLERLGLSSLGRAEAHVLGTLDLVLNVLGRIAATPGQRPPSLREKSRRMPHGFELGRCLLERRAEQLLGPEPTGRSVRIMVTLPSEAATQGQLVREFLQAGMNLARINCAHDSAPVWANLVEHVARAARELNRPCRVLMDLSGPKLRTAQLPPGPRVLKFRPVRTLEGAVEAPAEITLCSVAEAESLRARGECVLAFDERWLARLCIGSRVSFEDLRGRRRKLLVTGGGTRGWRVELERTAYVGPSTRFVSASGFVASPLDMPALEPSLLLHNGDLLNVVREGGQGAAHPKSVGCTLPQVFDCVRPGQRIWFDDGKIGGVISEVGEGEFSVLITQASPAGSKLRMDKGINLPDTELELPFLNDVDRRDLAFAAKHADVVGLSFVQSSENLEELAAELRALGCKRLGVMLKIETRRAFENLPSLLLASLGRWPVGVMIARGDLALEVGYERLAEVQEEILWVSEAAHVPVVWATAVLESLAKRGVPSRAEITDAAMSQRAECVMLNKGPYATNAIRLLDDILHRMQAHQRKKTAILRPLRAFSKADETTR